MPLETGNSIPDLNASNPAHTDGINAGDAHLRLIKSVLKNTFPNFTNASLVSTQAAIDAAATFTTGAIKVAVDGTMSAPAYSFASEATLGFYRKATNTLALSISGIDVWKISGGGVDIITAGALLAGGTPIFPLQTANIGALQVTNAKIAHAAVTYGLNGSLQNSAAANVLLGSTTVGGFFGEITMGSGIGIVAGALTNTAQFQPIPMARVVAIDNDGTNPSTKINITADFAILGDVSNNTQRYSGISTSVDFTTTGAGGCDVSTRAANKGYYIWLIGDGTNCRAVASLDTNAAPTLPGSFTAYKYVGWYHTDGSSNLARMRWRGADCVYTTPPGLAIGTNAGAGVSLSGVVSPNATKAGIIATASSSNVAIGPNSSVTLLSTSGGVFLVDVALDSGLTFFYSSSASGGSATLRGFSFPP